VDDALNIAEQIEL